MAPFLSPEAMKISMRRDENVILIGTILLMLPISSTNGEFTNILDAMFTSTSAVCVTGLIALDTATHWSTFGQCIILLLIEIGGLGFMSFTTLLAILIGKKITLNVTTADYIQDGAPDVTTSIITIVCCLIIMLAIVVTNIILLIKFFKKDEKGVINKH